MERDLHEGDETSDNQQRDELPDVILGVYDNLEERGYTIMYGEIEDEGRPAVIGERDGAIILVADWGQTWGVTMMFPDRPDIRESWDRPGRVAGEVERWVDEFED